MAKAFDLLGYAYAHRGLWQKDGPEENSIAAYKAAAAAGLGIEMDVRPAVDGTPVCFHDLSLSRVTSHEGFVSDYTSDVLAAFKLTDGETIPLLSDLLAFWPHHLPIIVEMKIDGDTDPGAFTRAVADQIAVFEGLASMMSFNEEAVAAIPQGIARGQVVEPSTKIGAAAFEAKVERALSNDIDYLALNVSDADAGSHHSIPTVCWTVRSEEQRAYIRRLGMAEIYEHLPSPLAASEVPR